jgi:hypothetical protein
VFERESRFHTPRDLTDVGTGALPIRTGRGVPDPVHRMGGDRPSSVCVDIHGSAPTWVRLSPQVKGETMASMVTRQTEVG